MPDLPREHSRRRFIFSEPWLIAGITLALTGCAKQSPIFHPSSPSETSVLETTSALKVLLTPVDTSGIISPAKSQYGLDVSAYFTAFELQLVNQSGQPVDFESQEIYLVHADGKRQPVLTEEESIDYYRYGDLGPDGAKVLLSKPLAMMREEIEQIRRLRIRSATLLPGESLRGIVFFKKVGPDRCHDIHIQLQGITFTEAARSKDVDLAFFCKDQ